MRKTILHFVAVFLTTGALADPTAYMLRLEDATTGQTNQFSDLALTSADWGTFTVTTNGSRRYLTLRPSASSGGGSGAIKIYTNNFGNLIQGNTNGLNFSATGNLTLTISSNAAGTSITFDGAAMETSSHAASTYATDAHLVNVSNRTLAIEGNTNTWNGSTNRFNSAVNAFGVGGGILTNYSISVVTSGGLTNAVTTNGAAITISVVNTNAASGGSGSPMTIARPSTILKGSDLKFSAVSNLCWKVADELDDGTLFSTGVGIGSYETNSLQIGKVKGVMPVPFWLQTFAQSNALNLYYTCNLTNPANVKFDLRIDGLLYTNTPYGPQTNKYLIYSNAANNASAANTPLALNLHSNQFSSTTVPNAIALTVTAYIKATNANNLADVWIERFSIWGTNQ